MQQETYRTLEILLPVKQPNVFQKIWTNFINKQNYQKAKLQLRKMDDRLLEDIGLSRNDVGEKSLRFMFQELV